MGRYSTRIRADSDGFRTAELWSYDVRMTITERQAALFRKDRGAYGGAPAGDLALSLYPEVQLKDARLFHTNSGDINVPSGKLIACDPFVMASEAIPFAMEFPKGRFPVRLSIWENGVDQRVAFASVVFKNAPPVAWEMLTLGKQSVATLKNDEIFGYGVDSGTGCFMAVEAQRGLSQLMESNDNWFEELADEMDKTYRHTWSWLNKEFDGANLVCFSSGLGDGFYASYAGRDEAGEICTVVTDFGVCGAKEFQRQP